MSLSKIRKLNDKLRQTGQGGKIILTEGIGSLCITLKHEIICEVRDFKHFNEYNDPFKEHDFGSFKHPIAGKIFWKIDYYDLNMENHSEDSSDSTKTKRVLTIMLANEY